MDSLDSADVIDQLTQYQKHYLPDETPDEVKMEEPDDDSCAIAEMELEYLGVVSTWEDQHGGEYGNVPMYNAVPSPQGANEDDDGMLKGSMVKVLPETEAALLQLDDVFGDWPTRQVVAPEQLPSITKDWRPTCIGVVPRGAKYNRGLKDHVPRNRKIFSTEGKMTMSLLLVHLDQFKHYFVNFNIHSLWKFTESRVIALALFYFYNQNLSNDQVM